MSTWYAASSSFFDDRLEMFKIICWRYDLHHAATKADPDARERDMWAAPVRHIVEAMSWRAATEVTPSAGNHKCMRQNSLATVP